MSLIFEKLFTLNWSQVIPGVIYFSFSWYDISAVKKQQNDRIIAHIPGLTYGCSSLFPLFLRFVCILPFDDIMLTRYFGAIVNQYFKY